MKRYKVRTATGEDFEAISGGRPPYATRAWAVDHDGEVSAIAGVHLTPGGVLIFSDLKDGLDVPKLTIWRATLEVFEKIKNLKMPMFAVCTGEFMNSGPFLERLGFESHGVMEGMEVYRWPQQ